MVKIARKHAFAAIAALVPFAAQAQDAITLPDPAFAPEGISAAADGSLYSGSLKQGRIVRIMPDGSVTDFIAAGANGLVSVLGTHVSADNQSLYACSSDPGFGDLTGSAKPALVRFNLSDGSADGRFELPEGGFICNDIAEMPDGTMLVTDSFAPRIYALRPGATELEIWYESADLQSEGFNLNGIAYSEGSVYFVRYTEGLLYRIGVKRNGDAGRLRQIELPRKINGADGLEAQGDGKFILVEGGGLQAGARGAILGLDVKRNKAMITVLADDVNVPTTATVVGDALYVVEGQLDHLFDPSAGPADPYRILKLDLPASFQ